MKNLQLYIKEAIINKDLTLNDILIDYIDLGLKSGTLWATCNLGAKKPEEYGLYFQWGATEGYKDASHSTWETCPFNDGIKVYDRIYFKAVKDEVCPNGILATEYDAAYVVTNRKAHMPTKEQFKELENLKHEWTELNGVKGLKIIGNNGNSIFIPAAGYAHNGSVGLQRFSAYIWGSSLASFNLDSAYSLNYNSDSLGYGLFNSDRFYAFPVRAVKDK